VGEDAFSDQPEIPGSSVAEEDLVRHVHDENGDRQCLQHCSHAGNGHRPGSFVEA
jgi:hypothetical protein